VESGLRDAVPPRMLRRPRPRKPEVISILVIDTNLIAQKLAA